MGEKRIAVASELSNVRNLLEEEGYTVVSLQGTDLKQVNAVVVSGVSDDLMGIQDTGTPAPVISADGRAPEDILEDIERSLALQ